MAGPEKAPEKVPETEKSDDEILKEAGLNQSIRSKLADNSIFVEVVGSKDERKPYVDTDYVYYQIPEGDSFRSSKLSFLPLDGKDIQHVTSNSDGVSTFHLVDRATGKEEIFIFSKTKEMPDYYKPSHFNPDASRKHTKNERETAEEASRQQDQSILDRIEEELTK